MENRHVTVSVGCFRVCAAQCATHRVWMTPWMCRDALCGLLRAWRCPGDVVTKGQATRADSASGGMPGGGAPRHPGAGLYGKVCVVGTHTFGPIGTWWTLGP